MSLLKGGMDLPSPEQEPMAEEELAIMEKLARKVTERGFTVPAILFLESVKPLNYIGSQTMVFFEPIIQTVFNIRDYDTFRCALEKRQSIELLIQMVEKYDAVEVRKERLVKKYYKEQKKNWKWYQRYLGLFAPKVVIPPEVLNPPLNGNPQASDDSTPTDNSPPGKS